MQRASCESSRFGTQVALPSVYTIGAKSSRPPVSAEERATWTFESTPAPSVDPTPLPTRNEAYVRLNNGVDMPLLGFGTAALGGSDVGPSSPARKAMRWALQAGCACLVVGTHPRPKPHVRSAARQVSADRLCEPGRAMVPLCAHMCTRLQMHARTCAHAHVFKSFLQMRSGIRRRILFLSCSQNSGFRVRTSLSPQSCTPRTSGRPWPNQASGHANKQTNKQKAVRPSVLTADSRCPRRASRAEHMRAAIARVRSSTDWPHSRRLQVP